MAFMKRVFSNTHLFSEISVPKKHKPCTPLMTAVDHWSSNQRVTMSEQNNRLTEMMIISLDPLSSNLFFKRAQLQSPGPLFRAYETEDTREQFSKHLISLIWLIFSGLQLTTEMSLAKRPY
jgi:hypothetical protein